MFNISNFKALGFLTLCCILCIQCNVDGTLTKKGNDIEFIQAGITSNKFDSFSEQNLEISKLRAIDSEAILKKMPLILTGIKSSSHYIIKDLPLGYVKDGSMDYTKFVQEALNKYDNLVFPSFPLLINDNGLKIKSNTTITFLKGSELRLKPSLKKSYGILDIKDVSNIKIYNPVIIGDRYSHLGTEGEWGMGIRIAGSHNIKIYSPKVTNCWGDGIYIGQSNYGTRGCKDILIKDAYLRKNRRDGMSVISVDGLLVDNIYAGYSDGTGPWCGINFEPDNDKCELQRIRINNPRTEYNGKFGVQVVNRRMLERVNKTTEIIIVNHVDVGSPKNAFKMYCNPTSEKTAKMFGKVVVINPTWIKSSKTDMPIDVSSNQRNYKLLITSPSVVLNNGKTLSYQQIYDLFMQQSSRINLSVKANTSE